MNTHRIFQANDIPDPTQPATPFDENEIREGARALIIEQQRVEIAAQAAEIVRLNQCIRALEREGLDLAEKQEREDGERADRHNACETPRSGQTENFWN